MKFIGYKYIRYVILCYFSTPSGHFIVIIAGFGVDVVVVVSGGAR